jgi:hypothetical protein
VTNHNNDNENLQQPPEDNHPKADQTAQDTNAPTEKKLTDTGALNPDIPVPQPDQSDNDVRLTTHRNHTDTGVLNIQKDKRPRFGSGGGNVSGAGTGKTGLLGDQSEIIFVIRGIVERVVVPKGGHILLGRSDPRNRNRVDLDLTPYGALDRGVSREHVRMHVEEGRLLVTDLGSTNGTFLANVRLEPETPTILRKGDELLLGRLPIQILFR